jgi:hypothetical protein
MICPLGFPLSRKVLNFRTPGEYRENLVLNLPPGDYKAEWIDPASYSTLATEKFKQTGALRVIDKPAYVVDIALRIMRE